MMADSSENIKVQKIKTAIQKTETELEKPLTPLHNII